MRDAVGRWWPAAWVAVLVLLVLLPTLAAGYVLSYDMVFVPRQDLLPATLGLTDALPRAVPQDAVVALLNSVLAGWGVQKLALVGALLGAGLGVVRLLRDRPGWVRALGGTLAVWNAYVAERLVQGHWGLLLAYAVLPWSIAAATEVRCGRRGAAPRLVLLLALAALTPTGGLLAAVVALPIAILPGGVLTGLRRAGLAAAVALVNAPWWLPAVLGAGAAPADPAGVTAFALRSQGDWGPWLTALGTGGIWNAEATPASRGWWSAPFVAVLVAALAVAGARPLARQLGRLPAAWLACVALAGLLLAGASGTGALEPAVAWLGTHLPGGGLLRDAQKWLAPLALLLSLAAPLGLHRLLRGLTSRDRTAAGSVVALALVVPLVALPDLAWGVAGRLQAVAYPAGWEQVRARLQDDPAPGDLAVVPWETFRSYAWNGHRTLLDPAPRWSPRPSVADDTLVVASRGGGTTTVAGEDPRSAAVAAAIATGRPAAETLPPLGIGWVLEEVGQPPGTPAALLAGLSPVVDADGLRLYRLPGVPRPWPGPPWAPWVVATDAAVLLLLAAALVGIALAAVRRPTSRNDAPSAGTVTGVPFKEAT